MAQEPGYGMNRRKVLFFALLPLPLLAMQIGAMMASPKQPPLPEVTEYEKLRLEMNAMRKVQDAILIYVRPNDDYAEKFAQTLKEAGIPNLPGVR